MVGTTLTNLFVLGTGPWLPLGLLVVSALVAWGRWPWTKVLLGKLGRDLTLASLRQYTGAKATYCKQKNVNRRNHYGGRQQR
jgi:hypothetical protein